MPEGHVIHRLADGLTELFGGRTVRVASPQGRFADEAAVSRLLGASRLWAAATSFGGVHSTIDRRAQWGGDAVATNGLLHDEVLRRLAPDA